VSWNASLAALGRDLVHGAVLNRGREPRHSDVVAAGADATRVIGRE
jgi:hypothetical protein